MSKHEYLKHPYIGSQDYISATVQITIWAKITTQFDTTQIFRVDTKLVKQKHQQIKLQLIHYKSMY